MAFVICYVAAHPALDLLHELQVEEMMAYCKLKLERIGTT